MSKKIINILKVQIKGGQANPAPPVGTVLGPTGINIMSFCKDFNEKTKEQNGTIVPAVITIYEDRTFSFIIKTSPAAALLKKIAGIEKGSGIPNKDKVAKITRKQLKEIAEYKMVDLNSNDIDSAIRIIEGTARSMGFVVEE